VSGFLVLARFFQFFPVTAPLPAGSGELLGQLFFMAFYQNLMGLDILQSCARFDLFAMLSATSKVLQMLLQLCNDRWMNHHFSGHRMLQSWDMAQEQPTLPNAQCFPRGDWFSSEPRISEKIWGMLGSEQTNAAKICSDIPLPKHSSAIIGLHPCPNHR
jgi:hypothetical protein